MPWHTMAYRERVGIAFVLLQCIRVEVRVLHSSAFNAFAIVAKEFGATEFFNPSEYTKPVQQATHDQNPKL